MVKSILFETNMCLNFNNKNNVRNLWTNSVFYIIFRFFFTAIVEFLKCFLILASVDTTQWNMTFTTPFQISNLGKTNVGSFSWGLWYVLSNYFVLLKCGDSFFCIKSICHSCVTWHMFVCKIIENYPLKQLN